MCFHPNLSSCIIRLYLIIIDLVNFVFSDFSLLVFKKFLSNSMFNFSMNLDLNRAIFHSVDSSFSSLSKSITIPNFSPQFIIFI